MRLEGKNAAEGGETGSLDIHGDLPWNTGRLPGNRTCGFLRVRCTPAFRPSDGHRRIVRRRAQRTPGPVAHRCREGPRTGRRERRTHVRTPSPRDARPGRRPAAADLARREDIPARTAGHRQPDRHPVRQGIQRPCARHVHPRLPRGAHRRRNAGRGLQPPLRARQAGQLRLSGQPRLRTGGRGSRRMRRGRRKGQLHRHPPPGGTGRHGPCSPPVVASLPCHRDGGGRPHPHRRPPQAPAARRVVPSPHRRPAGKADGRRIAKPDNPRRLPPTGVPS